MGKFLEKMLVDLADLTGRPDHKKHVIFFRMEQCISEKYGKKVIFLEELKKCLLKYVFVDHNVQDDILGHNFVRPAHLGGDDAQLAGAHMVLPGVQLDITGAGKDVQECEAVVDMRLVDGVGHFPGDEYFFLYFDIVNVIGALQPYGRDNVSGFDGDSVHKLRKCAVIVKIPLHKIGKFRLAPVRFVISEQPVKGINKCRIFSVAFVFLLYIISQISKENIFIIQHRRPTLFTMKVIKCVHSWERLASPAMHTFDDPKLV